MHEKNNVGTDSLYSYCDGLINCGKCESEHFADKRYFAIVYILKCEGNDRCGKKARSKMSGKIVIGEKKNSRQPSNFSSPFDHPSNPKTETGKT